MMTDPIDFLSNKERRAIRRNQEDGYVQLLPLLHELGIKIVERDLSYDVSGFSMYEEGISPSGFAIVINGNHPIVRRRFTAAHEIGHCLLHSDQVKEGCEVDAVEVQRSMKVEYDFLLDDWVSDPFVSERDLQIEREADTFAAALLMPRPAVKDARRKGVWRYADLAKIFGVSTGTAIHRIQELRGPRCRVAA